MDEGIAPRLQKYLLQTGKKRSTVTEVSTCDNVLLHMQALESKEDDIFTETWRFKVFDTFTEGLRHVYGELHRSIAQGMDIGLYLGRFKQQPSLTWAILKNGLQNAFRALSLWSRFSEVLSQTRN